MEGRGREGVRKREMGMGEGGRGREKDRGSGEPEKTKKYYQYKISTMHVHSTHAALLIFCQQRIKCPKRKGAKNSNTTKSSKYRLLRGQEALPLLKDGEVHVLQRFSADYTVYYHYSQELKDHKSINVSK